MRYFIELSYDGAPYHGWHEQPNATSVQQSLQEALGVILRLPTPVTGAGRTDTGVHARVMYAHFDTLCPIADPVRVVNGLNRLCGPAIAVRRIIPVADDAHARFDATQRTYKYFVTFDKSPFLNRMSWHSPARLDVAAMNAGADILMENEDFTSFAKLHSDARTNICHLTEARWDTWHNDFGTDGIVFTISADRFLRNMVRAVVGTLVEMGRGKLDADGLRHIIECKDRCSAGTSMPPQALFLWDVRYPYI